MKTDTLIFIWREVIISELFFFSGKVNNNGLISFVFANEGYTPEEFPLNDTFFNAPLIAPYWADVDTTGTGNVWYRQTSDEEEITKVRGIVANAFPSLQKDFLATQVLFIATWDKVGYFFSGTDKVINNYFVNMNE